MITLNTLQTKQTPQVFLDENRQKLFMSGNSIMLDPASYYKNIIFAVKKLKCSSLEIKINLNYINSASVFPILEIFNAAIGNSTLAYLQINWVIETDDDDMAQIVSLLKNKIQNNHDDSKIIEFEVRQQKAVIA
jgi:hypothetical protein